MKRLDYSIVIATRNRPAALRLSIPRMLGQSRPPAQLIVVDSSDDHQATVDAVKESVGENTVELTILESVRGLTRQRNAGLDLVRHPIAFFPDDDSIWFPGVASAQMDVYEKDTEGRIAAVCAAESSAPPPDWMESGSRGYRMSTSHRMQQRVAGLRSRIENCLFTDPAKVLGQSMWPSMDELPQWFAKHDVVLVEWMTGFRMSFRSDAIRNSRFDESFSRYSLFEDIDASFSCWKHGWVVGARKAKVFHYRSPEKRDQGWKLGVEQLANKAYVLAKHSNPSHQCRRAMKPFAKYKIFQYSLAAKDDFGKDRLAGARFAAGKLDQLCASTWEAALGNYQSLMSAAKAARSIPGADQMTNSA